MLTPRIEQADSDTICRRGFLLAGTGLLGAALLPGSALAQAEQVGLRTLSYNVLACKGYPETEPNRARLVQARPQMVQRMALELGLYAPDIVTFQESPSEETVAAIAGAMGRHYTYFPGGFPGAVISRFKILESQNCPLVQGPRPRDLFSRHWGRAVLDISGSRLTLYSAHLHPSDAAVRAREVTEALATMAADIAADGPLLFQGDLNHEPEGPEYPRWQAAGLVDAFVAGEGSTSFTIPSTSPRARIDYIWSNAALAARRQACRVLFEGAFRTNPADERSFALSDHLPVMADFAALRRQ
jgi:endonuclease/exonuclease/phosphatase family metal-dependent hydrolase